MAIRNPTSLVTSYNDRDCYPRKPIVTTHFDAALDNQELTLRNPKVLVSEGVFPNSSSGASFTEVWRTSLYTRHKAGASFGSGTIGRVLVYMYEHDAAGGAPTTGSYQIRITDGTNTDTTTVSTFSTTGHWVPLTISTVVGAAADMSARTELKIEVGNFDGLGGDPPTLAWFCGVYILDND
jgi:hypothetical protein